MWLDVRPLDIGGFEEKATLRCYKQIWYTYLPRHAADSVSTRCRCPAPWLEVSTVVADCTGPVSIRMRCWLLDDLFRKRVKNRRVTS